MESGDGAPAGARRRVDEDGAGAGRRARAADRQAEQGLTASGRGIEDDGCLPVRPDGHLAWRARSGPDPDALLDAVARTLGTPAPPKTAGPPEGP
ncbi:hypothetical protein ABZZ80_00790 [Streptomyces sp. NPDC006356]